MQTAVLTINSAAHMETLGAAIARACPVTAIIFLQGGLGAGKTTFTRGFLTALGHAGKVKSPTYTLVEPYCLEGRDVFHFDLYRLQDPEELHFIGMSDYARANAVCLIEWPEKAKSCLPAPDLTCIIAHQQEQREVTLVANTDIGLIILRQWHDEAF